MVVKQIGIIVNVCQICPLTPEKHQLKDNYIINV